MIDLAIIGAGTMAQRHINVFRAMNDVNIRAICDIDESLVNKIASQYSSEPYTDYQLLLDDDEITAIDICVPTPFHSDIIINSLKKNKHVFCEKPLTDKIKNLDKIKEMYNKKNRVLMSGYLYNFHPSFKRLKNLLEDKVIGDPYYAIFRLGGRGNRRNWKHYKKSGGGALLEVAVHMLDLAYNYFGSFKEIKCLHNDIILRERIIENQKMIPDAEDLTSIHLKTYTDVNIFIQADLISPSYMNYVEVHGTNGSYFCSILNDFPCIVYCNEPRGIYDQGRNVFSNEKVDLIKEELKFFINSINGIEPPINSLEKEYEILKVIEEVRNQRNKVLG